MNNQDSKLSRLTSITSLDGRYRERIEDLSTSVSEYGLIKNRIQVEVRYLLNLSDAGVTRKFTDEEKKLLSDIVDGKNVAEDIVRVKEIEEETRHDVKAVERMLREKLEPTSLKDQLEMIHFGLTSEDINNLSYRLQLKEATSTILIPTLNNLIGQLIDWAQKYKRIPMLARTHGQAAVPTTLGKEISVFATRLHKQVNALQQLRLTGKLTGAVGNFNALLYTYPGINWIRFSEEFVSSFDLEPNLNSTQTNPPEDILEFIQTYQRINGIIIDLNQDIWRYISDHWITQIVKQGEVGSSTMPQKVNPIDFENSEARLGIANSMGDYFVRKLPVSRLQRDLSDSTVLREIGTFLANSLIGYKSTLMGFSRIEPNKDEILNALNKDWSILSEGQQTLLRKNKFDNSYTEVATAVRGKQFDGEFWKESISKLSVDEETKNNLLKLTPETYIGLAIELTEKAIEEIKSSK